MATKTEQDPPVKAGYKRVPVEDVFATDEEVEGRTPNQKYDWIALADKAIKQANKKAPWVLVDRNASKSVSSNITQRRIRTLSSDRYVGWSFRGRLTDMQADPETGRYKRGTVWIKAIRTGVDV